jgi:hypothetical protein
MMKAIQSRVARAAPDMAMAMGQTHEKYLVGVTLVQSGSHPPVTRTPAAPGAPPAQMPGGLNGSLRESVNVVRGPGTGMVGSSVVGPHVIYSCAIEFGGTRSSSSGLWLWVGYIGPQAVRRRGWVKSSVHIPARPYMMPSRQAVIANGSVTAAADASFMRQVWG